MVVTDKAITSGRQLKAARIIAGLSVREMANLAGINRNSVSRVENLDALPYRAWAADRMATTLQNLGVTFSVIDGQASIHFSPSIMRRGKKQKQ